MVSKGENEGATEEAGQTPEGASRGLGAWKTMKRLPLGTDTVFVLILLVMFSYVLVVGSGYRERSSFVPVFAGGLGLTLLAVHIVQEAAAFFGRRRRSKGRVLDIAFDLSGVAERVVWLRTGVFAANLAGLILGIYLVNFHIAVPLYLFGYLRLVSKAPWRAVVLITVIAEAIVVLFYGGVIHTIWPESILERLFLLPRTDLQEIRHKPFDGWL